MARSIRFVDKSVDWLFPDHKVMYINHRNGSGMGHKSYGKYKVGPGGLGCPCCTKLPPNEMKVKIRRYERRKSRVNLQDIISKEL